MLNKYVTLKNISVIGSVASLLSLIAMFFYPSIKQYILFSVEDNSKIDEVNIVYNRTNVIEDNLLNRYEISDVEKMKSLNIKYFLGEDTIFTPTSLKATIDGNDYLIIEEREGFCIDIVEQKDFDGNGAKDALIQVITACGGNGAANSFFFVSYRDNGHFQISEQFGYSWGPPTIEDWKHRESVVIYSHNEGFNQMPPEEKYERYVLDAGQAIKIEESDRKHLLSMKELVSSDFDYNKYDEVKVINFDLNNDGLDDQIIGRFWHRWGRIMWSVQFNGKNPIEGDINCKRIGILDSKTNGTYNLVCDEDEVLKWDGSRYK